MQDSCIIKLLWS